MQHAVQTPPLSPSPPLWMRLARSSVREACYSLPIQLLIFAVLRYSLGVGAAWAWPAALFAGWGVVAVLRETIHKGDAGTP